ncbi:MAG: hypothetical protein OEW62_02270 [Candidatus Bathyarchaeota archaeon]|nr:hypothetical protein [Candidatus Bathyarchaeota archaeon]MDH5596336.1 hypothetical protein [Candidatus Bathyarchaeota archaeon]
METSKFKLAFTVLLIATIIWGITFYYTLQEYRRYCEWFKGSEGELPNPYYAWNGGLYVTAMTEILLLVWIPFIGYSVREKVYPYLKPRLNYQEVKGFYGFLSRLTYDILYGSVLRYFKSVNRKVRSKLAVWSMKSETLQHVDLMIKVFKWIILPASLLYVCADLYFFRENALDSMFLGILIFFYSNFLPDLPSIFRRKTYHDTRDTTGDLPWYKKYALLLFAPLFIGAFFLGTRLRWKTTENFHNFKSLAIYLIFLFTLSFFAFGDLPISIGDITEIVSVPLYGLIGYLTHLKVDLCL